MHSRCSQNIIFANILCWAAGTPHKNWNFPPVYLHAPILLNLFVFIFQNIVILILNQLLFFTFHTSQELKNKIMSSWLKLTCPSFGILFAWNPVVYLCVNTKKTIQLLTNSTKQTWIGLYYHLKTIFSSWYYNIC